MRAGLLKDIISIWRLFGTLNDNNERTDEWKCVGQYRAAKSVQNSSKALNNGEVWYPRAVVFRVRLGADIKEGDQVRLKDKIYDVESVTEDKWAEKCITVNCTLHNE